MPEGDTSVKAYLRVIVIAALLGVPAALAAVAFTSLLHDVTHLVWEDLPDAAGWSEPPWWYVISVPALGGAIVAATLRLPGHGGHGALGGLSMEPLEPIGLPSALAAALATLGLGLVLGPEGPLIALGLTMGLVAARWLRAAEQAGQAVVFAGAFATISTVFGGPLQAALLLFEVLARGGKLTGPQLWRVLIPGFVAAGTGALVFTGVADWPGVHEVELAIPGLPPYPTVRIVDLAWCFPVAVASAVAVAASVRLASGVSARGVAHPEALLVGAGLGVGIVAVIFGEIADRPAELVLFSGQSNVPAVIAEGSAGVLGLLIVSKVIAYALSLGGGFRGGPVFPAIAIGAAVGVLAAEVLPGVELTPALTAGIAAGAAASLQLPIFGALMASLLVGGGESETIPIAVLASVVGWFTAVAIEGPAGENAEGAHA